MSDETIEVVVDRIEGRYAVIETTEGTVDFPLLDLPPGTAEGSTLRISLKVEKAPSFGSPFGALVAGLKED